MYRCVMVEWLDDWSDAVRGTYARMAWIDHNAAAAQRPAQGDEGARR